MAKIKNTMAKNMYGDGYEKEITLDNGEKYIIRFKSPGREDRKIKHKDVIKGNVEFPENDQDIVIIKGHGDAPHRSIFEHDVIHQSWQEQEKQEAVLPESLCDIVLFYQGRLFLCRDSC